MQGCLTMIRTASTVDNCKIIQLFENEWCFTYVNLYIDNKFDMLKCRILSEKFRWANILFPAWEQTNAVEIFKTLYKILILYNLSLIENLQIFNQN